MILLRHFDPSELLLANPGAKLVSFLGDISFLRFCIAGIVRKKVFSLNYFPQEADSH